MVEDDVVLSKADLRELMEALEVIERHYPDREVRLIARNGQSQAANKGQKPAAPPKKRGGKKLKNRARVAEAATGKWVTLAQIKEATGLTSTQVHGAMLGKDGDTYVFERRLINKDLPNGAKEYRLKGS